LPQDLAAAVCVVIHTSPWAKSLLPRLIERAGMLSARYPEDGEIMEHCHIYVAPPDTHLTIEDGTVRLGKGPRENLSRPAIDPLFRTAAAAYNASVIGVILSGTLDDGTAGLGAIKDAGGITIVQTPDDTVFRGMPQSAIDHVKVDFVLPSKDIAHKLVSLCQESRHAKVRSHIPADLTSEIIDSFICPECGGTLTEEEGSSVTRFRCQIGHVLSLESLLAGQSQNLEKALWAAVRALKERAALALKLTARLRTRNHDSFVAAQYERQAEEALFQADQIEKIIERTREEFEPPEYKDEVS
jgi:two-component system chemotaxis response regulator CheB